MASGSANAMHLAVQVLCHIEVHDFVYGLNHITQQ